MTHRDEDIKARLLATFRVEAQEHLQAITANLLTLERGLPPAETREVVEDTFREAHTLKGAARSVGLIDVEALCQALESVLSRITRGHLALSRPVLYRVQEAVDGMAHLLTGGQAPAAVRGALIDRLERAATEPAVEEAQPIEETELPGEPLAGPTGPGLQPAANTIRLATASLDALLLQAEDLLVPKLAAEQRVREAKALVEALTHCRTALNRGRAAARPVRGNGPDADLPTGLESALRTPEAQAQELLRHLRRDQRTITAAVGGHQEDMRRLRMTPASAVLDLFPRMVRDLASEQGKEVEWEARGSDLEVDRRVLQGMKDPLVHLVRNAIDHGIELPEARAQVGKSPRGRVAVTIAALEGGRIEICVADDGRGIDLAQVRAVAVRSRLLSREDAQAMTDAEALELIYRSGLSTRPIITDLSGHGLGLAIVKERVEALGGRLHVETQADSGTMIRMILPATIATFRGLLVQAGGQPFLLPIEAIERAIRIAPNEVESVEGRDVIRWDGHALSVACLSGLLGLPERGDETEASSKQPCVIVRSGEDQVGLWVEEILGDWEVLVKELRPPLVRVRNVAGAGLLGTGQVVLIIRPADLLKSVRRNGGLRSGPTPIS